MSCFGFFTPAESNIEALLKTASTDPMLEKNCSTSDEDISDCLYKQDDYLSSTYYQILVKEGKIPPEEKSVHDQLLKLIVDSDKEISKLEIRYITEELNQKENLKNSKAYYDAYLNEMKKDISVAQAKLDDDTKKMIEHMRNNIKMLIKK